MLCSRRKLLTWLALTAALPAMGCGFEPVYRQDSGLAERMTGIEVVQVKSRIGQAVRDSLLHAIGTTDNPANPTHRLTLTVTSGRSRGGIQGDETASRINVVLTTKWRLQRLGGDEPLVLASGEMRRAVPYSVVNDHYATLIAARNAEKLAGRLSGEAIRTQLILSLRQG